MRRLWIALASLVAVVLLLVALIFAASEMGGEVITLRTLDADGAYVETRVWIVEDDGFAWLRSGVPISGWLARIDANPRVSVTRRGETRDYRAVPVRGDPARRDRVHALMREHYGVADAFVSLIRDAAKSVPVRLEPIPQAD